MRIEVGLISPFPPQLGGVATVAAWLQAHETDIGCSYVPFSLERPSGEVGGRFTARSVPSQLGLFARFFPWALRSPRTIHCMVSPTLTGLSRDITYMAILALLRKRIAAHVHTINIDAWWWRLMTRAVGRLATTVIVLGNPARSSLTTLGISSDVVPNALPFDRKRFDNVDRYAAKAGGSPFRLLFVGAFGRQKGCPELIEAVALARADGVDCYLDIVGHQKYQGEERQLRNTIRACRLAEIVTFAGQCTHDELGPYYSRSDAFCLPSHQEGLPLSLIEAMSYGLPAIATPVGCVEDLVIDGETGLLAPVNDPVALAKQIVRLARDPDLRMRIAQNGARHVATHMASTVVARAWRGVYDRLA